MAIEWDGLCPAKKHGLDNREQECGRCPKFYEWTVKIRVSANWVADGFDLDADRLHDMVTNDLSFAHMEEVECEIVKAPDQGRIAREQGYEDAPHRALARGK